MNDRLNGTGAIANQAVSDSAALGEETFAAWRLAFAEMNKGLMWLATVPHLHRENITPLSEEEIEALFAGIQNQSQTPARTISRSWYYLASQTEAKLFIAFWKRPELTIVHLLRFCIQAETFHRHLDPFRPYLVGWWFSPCIESFRKTRPGFGLRELAAGYEAVGLDPAMIGRVQLTRFGSNHFDWEPALVLPYWSEHLDLLEEYFRIDSGGYASEWRRYALEVIALFPQPPARFVAALWELALGNAKSDRLAAQECLERVPDKIPRLLAALASGKADTRSVAADWLRRLRDPVAIEPLLKAVKKEKNVATKGAIMTALEQLGVPVEQFLDRGTLFKEALEGLAKGVPEALATFPLGLLPAVHWADSGAQVEPEIVQWWIVQQYKLKSPEPGPLLRRYCDSLREREVLGQFVLDAWIASDTGPISRADAEQRARRHAQAMVRFDQHMAQLAKQHPSAVPAIPPPKSFEEHYAAALSSFLQQPEGSAIGIKGVLAVAAACGGSGLASTVQAYLKQWYGMRAAQCRALLQMLAWVEHSSATQLLLATGSRFRTKSIQEEANRQTQLLAERKGWTLDELGDRTIPGAGLDEEGALELDFGSRHFTARLNAALDLVLFDSDGKSLKTLPEPRKDDERAAGAKKLLAAAKKELKSVLSMQRDRLYEAMCVERRWRLEDWELYLNRHPIMRHYTQRLVWTVFRDGAPVLYFRPMADGSLTGIDDQAVHVDAEEIIGLAHECHATPAISSAWLEHLSDYVIEPLFNQFGMPVFTPGEEERGDIEMREFEGYLVESFKLRSRATKLGYTRGQPQDGGWFYEYRRRFPSLGLEVLIEFSGSRLPEENRPVALRSLSFSNTKLGDVPPVLLSECWNALRQIAAEGSGFDPQWEAKIER